MTTYNKKKFFCFFENFLLVLQNHALLKLEESKSRVFNISPTLDKSSL